MRKIVSGIGCVILMLQWPQSAFAQGAEALIPLTNQDMPRSALAEMTARMIEPQTKGVGVPFYFPENVKEQFTYGIDVSHHNFDKGQKLDWAALADRSVYFVYIKATEGRRYFDPYFADNWKNASAMSGQNKRLRKGAYHFLRADDDPTEQAKTFLGQVGANFKAGRDLPPALDLEWDCVRGKNGRPILDAKKQCVGDNWSKYKPAEIVAKAEVWAKEVEAVLKVKPIYYTNAHWWAAVKLGSQPFFSDKILWVADYSNAAQKSGKPRNPATYSHTIWQFTENGKLTEACVPTDSKSQCTDTNVAPITKSAFEAAMGLTQ